MAKDLQNTIIEVDIHTTIQNPDKGDKLNSSKFSDKETWDIVHNLSELGLNIMDAFENFAARAEPGEATVDKFVEYVKSKDPQIICLTKQRLLEIEELYEADKQLLAVLKSAPLDVMREACRALAPELPNWNPDGRRGDVIRFKDVDPEGQEHVIEFDLGAEDMNTDRIRHSIDGQPFDTREERWEKAFDVLHNNVKI